MSETKKQECQVTTTTQERTSHTVCAVATLRLTPLRLSHGPVALASVSPVGTRASRGTLPANSRGSSPTEVFRPSAQSSPRSGCACPMSPGRRPPSSTATETPRRSRRRRRSASTSSRRPTRMKKCARRRKRISPRERRRCGWWRRKAKCASSTLPASVPRRASASTSRHRPLLRRPELRGGAPDQLALSSRCFVCAERAVQPGLRREATSSPTAPPSASSSPCDPRRSSAATGAHSSP